MEATEEKMLEQLVDFPTHIKGNTLDLLLTNVPERVEEVKEVGRLGHSDHMMIMASLTMLRSNPVREDLQPDWGKADWESMGNALNEQDWRELFRGKTAAEAWVILREQIHTVTASYVPLTRRRNGNRPGWLNQEILRAIRRKSRMWQKAKRGVDVDQYREEERRVRNMIRKAKRKFEKKIADGSCKDSVAKRKFYAYVKQKTKSRPSIGPLKAEDGRLVAEDEGMAEEFNTFFSTVFTREDMGKIPEPANQFAGNRLTTVQITTAKVKAKIRNLKRGSAPGPDKIGTQLLQELVDSIAQPLAAVMHMSLEDSTVPEDWRTANVTPIFKKGSKSHPGNYRPVTLTSVCGKMLESIIKDKWYITWSSTG